MAGEALYDDGLVTLDEQGITLRWYYFPIPLSKRIAYSDIRDVQQQPMTLWTGKGRLWGSGDLRHWAPLDVHRPEKDTAIILDLGGSVQPVFSPEHPELVVALLDKHVPAAAS
jgi:hypothetical protein